MILLVSLKPSQIISHNFIDLLLIVIHDAVHLVRLDVLMHRVSQFAYHLFSSTHQLFQVILYLDNINLRGEIPVFILVSYQFLFFQLFVKVIVFFGNIFELIPMIKALLEKKIEFFGLSRIAFFLKL